jgi:hypothetical protein
MKPGNPRRIPRQVVDLMVRDLEAKNDVLQSTLAAIRKLCEENTKREVPNDSMIIWIIEDIKLCVELEPASDWSFLYDHYRGTLNIISRDVIRADTVCFKWLSD